MPRRARLVVPEIPLHLVQRGNNGQAYFFAESDYSLYLAELLKHAVETGCIIHAYALMTNHVHLLISPKRRQSPGLLMKAVGQRYVQHINRTYERRGTLWEGRYRSCLVQSETYLLRCQTYIELNPVRAGMVTEAGRYRWSSYLANAHGEYDRLVEPHPVFTSLGCDDARRQEAYRALCHDLLDAGVIGDIRHATNGNFAFGDPLFAQKMSTESGKRAIPGLPGRPPRPLARGGQKNDKNVV